MKDHHVSNSKNPISEAMALVHHLAANLSTSPIENHEVLVISCIQALIHGRYPIDETLIELALVLESLSFTICRARILQRPGSYSIAARVFLAWQNGDAFLREFYHPVRIAFGQLAFITCVKCICYLSEECEYTIVPLRQSAPSKKNDIAWITPSCRRIDTCSTFDGNLDIHRYNKAFDIRKLFHCIYMIQTFAASESMSEWIRQFHDSQSQERLVLAQICMLSGNLESADNLISSNSLSSDIRFCFLNSTIKLCQRKFNDSLKSLICIVKDYREDFHRDALQPKDGVSSGFLGGHFEFVSGTPLMLECVRLIMACLSLVNFPVTIRIALCQYAWPKMQSELNSLISAHVVDNRLFEFEQFREQILHPELVDTFLALHRAGKLHMKLGVPQAKQGGRMLRGATKNLGITTERDLEDHIVFCGNRAQLIPSVLFSLITCDIDSLCTSN